MSYIEQFMPVTPQTQMIKPSIVVIEEDWKFISHIFPEPGFRSYFLGHIVSKLANELKSNGITDYYERSARPELADLPRLLSNVRLTRFEDHDNERRGVGSARGEDAQRTGTAAGAKESAGRQTEEGKDHQGGKDAQFVPAGLKQPTFFELAQELTRPLTPLERSQLDAATDVIKRS